MQKEDTYSQFENMGINRAVSPFLVKKGEWDMLLNADVYRLGEIRKRLGYNRIISAPDSASEVLSLIPFDINGYTKILMANAAGKMYATSNFTSWGTAIATGLSTTARWGYTTLNGYMFLGNGVEAKSTTAGTSLAAVSGMPLAKYWTTLFQRVYCAGVTASKSTLFWSVTGDGTNWSSVAPYDSSSTDIEKDHRGDIKNLGFSNDRILIFKNGMIKRWDGDYMRLVKSTRGLEAPYSLQETEGQLLLLDQYGIRVYDGTEPIDIARPLNDIVLGIDFSATNVERICSAVLDDTYYLSVGDVTLASGEVITNAMIVYNGKDKAFSLYSLAHHMTAATTIKGSDGRYKMYMGDVDGHFYEMWTGDTDYGTPIEMRLETPAIHPYDGGYTINPKTLTIVTENPAEIRVALWADNKFSEDIAVVTEPTENINVARVGAMNNFKLVFTHSSSGTPSLYGFSLDYVTEDKRIT